MKIAYLVHTLRDYDEIVENINQLVKQGDHVFIMINDDNTRDDVYFVYAESTRVHISKTQEFAGEGDMSMPRGTLLQLKEAMEYEKEHFDYYINLADGMIPLKPREEIVEYLEKNPGNYYYVDRSEDEDPKIRKQLENIYTLTQLIAFPRGKVTRWLCYNFANFRGLLHIKRKIADKIYTGSPYFILQNDAAKILAEHFDYVSETFKLSWYPEENYLGMMMKKYAPDLDAKHKNKDMRCIGPDGNWRESFGPRSLQQEIINKYPEALFGGQISIAEDAALYDDYFDIYNKNYIEDKNKREEKKEFGFEPWTPESLVEKHQNDKNKDVEK